MRSDQKISGMNFYKSNSNIWLLQPYSLQSTPYLVTYFTQRRIHCWKHKANASSGMLCSSSNGFCFISSIVSNLRLLRREFSLGNKKKSADAKSGKYGGWWRTIILCFMQKSRIRSTEWAAVWSWWNTHSPLRQSSRLFLRTLLCNGFIWNSVLWRDPQ